MVRLSKIAMSAEMILMFSSLTTKKHDIRIFRDRIRSDSEKGDIEKSEKLRFSWYQQRKIHCAQVFIFMKRQLFFYNSVKF